MRLLSKEELQEKLNSEILKIGGDKKMLPAINQSNYNAAPFIEIDKYGYNYVCYERDVEVFRKLPIDTEQLLYEVFKDIAFSLATEWEVQNRRVGEDSRKQLFAKWIELIENINPLFKEKLKAEVEQILRYAPYSNK